MAILSKAEILSYIESRTESEKPLIEGMEKKYLNDTSYDLRLGEEFIENGYCCNLDAKSNQYITIPPHDLAVVSTKEKVHIPLDLVGRFGLRLSFVMKGLVLNNGPQIAPGYDGRLFCLLYNLTDKPVILAFNQPFATIEFEKLSKPLPVTEGYEGHYGDSDHISDAVKDIIPKSGLKDLYDQFTEMEKRLTKKVDRFYLSFFTVISIILALLGIIIAKNLGVLGGGGTTSTAPLNETSNIAVIQFLLAML